MPLLSVIVTLIVVGLLLYLVNAFIPMEPRIKQILNVFVVIVVILWLLNIVGLFSALGTIQTPRIR